MGLFTPHLDPALPTFTEETALPGGRRQGAARLRFVRVLREATRDDLQDWTVEVRLAGGLEVAHTHSERGNLVPPDVLQDMVYAVAQQSPARSLEGFAQELIATILRQQPQVDSAEVHVASHLWKRLSPGGEPHPTTFMKGSAECQTTWVGGGRKGDLAVRSGFRDMTVLNTTQPGRASSLPGELTALPEAADRLFGTEVTAEWHYTAAALAIGVDFPRVRTGVRESMLASFARQHPHGAQQLLDAMAQAALEASDAIDAIDLRLSHLPCPPTGRQRSGIALANGIFVVTEEPRDILQATVRRR